MSSFFSSSESESIVQKISAIESKSIAELRIHVEDTCDKLPFDRAIEVFHKLKMDQTEERTGVLIYLSTEDRKVAIYGDQGIHAKVGNEYWESLFETMKHKLKSESVHSGVIYAIENVGIKLIEHFPENNSPINELTNEISYGKI